MASAPTSNAWESHGLPQEIILQIRKELSKGDLKNLRLCCKLLDVRFGPPALESLLFVGSQNDVMKGLETFAVKNDLFGRETLPSYVKSFALHTLPMAHDLGLHSLGVPIRSSHPDEQRRLRLARSMLPKRILSILQTAFTLQYLDLNLETLTEDQSQALLFSRRQWSLPSLKVLKITANDFLMAKFLDRQRFPGLEALHLATGPTKSVGYKQAVKNFPKLKRLYVRLQPGADYSSRHCTVMVSQVVSRIACDFKHLLWLTIDGPEMLTGKSRGGARAAANQLNSFISVLQEMKGLKRLALRIRESTVRDKRLVQGGRRYQEMVERYYKQVLEKLSSSVKHVEEIAILTEFPEYHLSSKSGIFLQTWGRTHSQNSLECKPRGQWPGGLRDDN